MRSLSNLTATVVSGVLSVSVLSGMLVRHAWPLWTGDAIYLRVRPVDPRDLFRGDYVRLAYDVGTLRLAVPPALRTDPGPVVPGVSAPAPPPEVTPLGDWWTEADRGRLRGRRLYLQLEPRPSAVAGVPQQFVPVSIRDAPVDGAVNLAGRVTFFSPDATIGLRFGIDTLFVQEGAGRPIEDAIRRDAPVFAEVAVTGSGQARVRGLIIDGTSVR